MTKELPLSQGKTAIVDDGDFELVNQAKWYAKLEHRVYYAMNRRLGFLHRFILNAPSDKQVDHINGDGLDNRRANLRLASGSQNQHNSKIRSDNSSGYKGVYWDKGLKQWRAQIKSNNQFTTLGHFSDAKDAARAYDAAAIKYHGEFARLNFEREQPADDKPKAKGK